MKYKNRLPLLLTVFAVLFFFSPPDAHACSCASKPTVLDEYEESDFVVVARAASVEKAEKAAPEGQIGDAEHYVDGVKSTTMRVERVYKGSLKVGDEMIFAQGGGADCIWTFSEEDVGRRFLLYVARPSKNSRVWMAVTCGRSRPWEDAGDDLLYLDKMEKVRGKTRLSGTLEVWRDGGPALGGRVISVVGEKKTYEVKTDAAGVYEIYDLPAGKYTVEVEPPAGWKVAAFRPSYSSREGYGGYELGRSSNKTSVAVEAGKHTGLNIRFEIDNAIRGKVLDAGGRPMPGVCVKAVRARADEKGGYHFDCTEGDGSFTIAELEPGGYLLVANAEGKISSSEPFKTIYYPNVFERERAAVITIGAGDVLEDFNILVPKMEETVTVEGVFLYSDGKPVADEGVEFKAEKVEGSVTGDARTTTDEKGRFRLKILKGLQGELHGQMYAHVGEYENCPKLDAIIKKAGGSVPEIRTPAVKIRADADLFDVELKYPFPGCKKAK